MPLTWSKAIQLHNAGNTHHSQLVHLQLIQKHTHSMLSSAHAAGQTGHINNMQMCFVDTVKEQALKVKQRGL